MTLKSSDLRSVGSGSAVSSVVEHYLDTVGVASSSLASRTILDSQDKRSACPLVFFDPLEVNRSPLETDATAVGSSHGCQR